MKMIARGSLGALMTCVAAAVAAPSAAAGPQVPVAVPLDPLERAVPLEAPTLRTGLPVPVPGAPEGPRYVEGKMLPSGILPQVPLTSDLPRTHVGVPLPHPLNDEGVGTVHASAPEADLVTATPGADVAAPLTTPRPGTFGLPGLALPEAGVLVPELRATPRTVLGFEQ
ncbi:hypothetical protein [Streptomyces sp. NPDC059909]|uniref:hypothetical protein n=1 Tax=Streptomyces sp. NPDC059909 TaxID=3346998 RepID=UPI0036487992